MLNRAQRKALKPYLKGKHITDYGCGDFTLTRELVKLGAEHVTAIDKQGLDPEIPRVTFQRAYFDKIRKLPQHLFLSWPINHVCDAMVIAAATAETVVYLGKNTDGMCCGPPGLFEVLVRREVLAYVPWQPNTLIIYGKLIRQPNEEPREPLFEEMAGLGAYTGGSIVAYRDG